MTEKAKNEFKVPKKQWKKWTELGRHVFNKNYGFMLANQELCVHPFTTASGGIPEGQWRVICWNASWNAADLASRGEKYGY